MFPPEVNQTHRTAQKWQLLVPRLRQVQRLERHSQRRTNTPVLNLFMKGISLDMWDKLARPNLSIPTSATRQVGILAASRTIPCRLESMPGELLAMILRDCSLTREEVIAVGLASRILSQHALRHIEQDCRTSFAPWAGMEIAYTGTWLTDLPESFARNDMAKSSVPARGRGRMSEARKINWAAMDAYDPPAQDPELAWREAFTALATGCNGSFVGKAEMKLMSEALSASIRNVRRFDHGTRWVFRNLNTKEYIRCRLDVGPLGHQGIVENSEVDWLRLDHVLMMRICWTSTSSEYSAEKMELCHGRWAGHCFDIVMIEVKDTDMMKGGWIDITDDTVKNAVHLFHHHPKQPVNKHALIYHVDYLEK